MPDYLHRTRKILLHAIDAADLPEPAGNYIQDPNLSAVTGQPRKYWVITGDVVSLADAAGQTAADAAEATEENTEHRAQNVANVDNRTSVGMQTRALLENANKRINWLTNRVIELQEDLQAIKASTGAAQNIRDAIRPNYLNTATRPLPDAVQAYKDEINSGDADG